MKIQVEARGPVYELVAAQITEATAFDDLFVEVAVEPRHDDLGGHEGGAVLPLITPLVEVDCSELSREGVDASKDGVVDICVMADVERAHIHVLVRRDRLGTNARSDLGLGAGGKVCARHVP